MTIVREKSEIMAQKFKCPECDCTIEYEYVVNYGAVGGEANARVVESEGGSEESELVEAYLTCDEGHTNVYQVYIPR